MNLDRFVGTESSLASPGWKKPQHVLDAIKKRREAKATKTGEKNCGSGAAGSPGFQPGNTCSGGGTSSSGGRSLGSLDGGAASREDVMAVFGNASSSATKQGDNSPAAIRERGQVKSTVVENTVKRIRGEIKEKDVDDELLKAVIGSTEPMDADHAESHHPKELRRGVAVQGIVDAWAGSSGDSDPVPVGIQQAIQKVLAEQVPELAQASKSHLGNYSGGSSTNKYETEDMVANHPVVHAVVKAQYAATQEYFKKRGITELVLHRGYSQKAPVENTDDATLVLQPASSFSFDRDTADSFAMGAIGRNKGIATIRVPVARVFSTPITGIGCLSEQEVVVLGGPIQATTVQFEERL